jgi:uncharacterized protein (TIGR00251 family)
MTAALQSFLREDKDGGIVIDIHVMPNAAQTRIQGLHDGALHVRLKAPPVEGKANAALVAWLAKTLGVPRSAVELLRGETARRKQLRVTPSHAQAADWDQLTPPPKAA